MAKLDFYTELANGRVASFPFDSACAAREYMKEHNYGDGYEVVPYEGGFYIIDVM